MANFDWSKFPQILMSHPWAWSLVLAWMLSILIYIILQIWFGYAWTGRWRLAALAPLIGLVLFIVLFVVVMLKTPDFPAPEGLQDFLVIPLLDSVILFSPLGFIYLLVIGIVHRVRGRPTVT